MCCLPVFVQREVIGQVFRRVARGEMFTAWDVRQSVQMSHATSGAGRTPHREVRGMVHALFFHEAMGPDYVRTVIPVGQSGETAFLYHRINDAPGLYGAVQKSVAALLRA